MERGATVNDRELLTAVKQSFAAVRADTPLDRIERRGRAVRTRQRGLTGAAATALAAAIAVTVVVSTGQATSPAPRPQLAAWTVTHKPGGIIEVQINQLKDPARLQATLRADGVPAFIRFQNQNPPPCLYDNVPHYFDVIKRIFPEPDYSQANGNTALDIKPSEIPAGVGIWLGVTTPQVSGSGQNAAIGFGWSTTLVYASGRCP